MPVAVKTPAFSRASQFRDTSNTEVPGIKFTDSRINTSSCVGLDDYTAYTIT